MAIYRVGYSSMTATYGPDFVQADSEIQAKLRYSRGAFSVDEMALISAREVSLEEMQRELRAIGECECENA